MYSLCVWKGISLIGFNYNHMYIIKEEKTTREDIENILLDGGIEKKYDYLWSREDNLSFQKKSQ